MKFKRRKNTVREEAGRRTSESASVSMTSLRSWRSRLDLLEKQSEVAREYLKKERRTETCSMSICFLLETGQSERADRGSG